jgi:hypothetical protein
MAKTEILKTSILKVTRMGSSPNGNPTYKLDTTDGVFRTATDAGIAYAATNFRPTWPATLRPVTLTLERKRTHAYVINIVDRVPAEDPK